MSFSVKYHLMKSHEQPYAAMTSSKSKRIKTFINIFNIPHFNSNPCICFCTIIIIIIIILLILPYSFKFNQPKT